MEKSIADSVPKTYISVRVSSDMNMHVKVTEPSVLGLRNGCLYSVLTRA